jgi:hypothetical protein
MAIIKSIKVGKYVSLFFSIKVTSKILIKAANIVMFMLKSNFLFKHNIVDNSSKGMEIK